MTAWADRRVLLTGVSSGIGRAAAAAWVRQGARVWGVARSTERLAGLAAELGGPPTFVPLPADVSDDRSMVALAERVLRELGVPDVVVANAGIGLDALLQHTTDDDLRRVLETNVAGVYRTIRPFIPGMLARGSGRIVVVSSVVGKRGVPYYSAYSASKFALHGMAAALRTELRGTGVTVGVLCPSSTRTEFQDRILRPGPSQPRVRVASHSPESAARALIALAGNRRREHVLSLEGKAMAWAEKIAPGVLDAVLARVLVRRKRGSPTV